jgi:hypothetical protein
MRQSAVITTVPSMLFWPFKSASDDLMCAITARPDGAVLPHVFKPWAPYERSQGLMKEVHAVSGEIQAALDARGCYLVRLRRFEAPITPDTPRDPNQLAKPITDPASGKKTEAKPEEGSHAAKEAPQGEVRATHGRHNAGLEKKNNRRHFSSIAEWFRSTPGDLFSIWPHSAWARRAATAQLDQQQRLATSAPRHWPNSRTTQHGGSDGPVAVALQIGFVNINMTATTPLRRAGACGAGLRANKSAGAFTGAGGSLCFTR